jgi:hypothetical protein
MADTANNTYLYPDTANNRYLYDRYCQYQISVWQILPVTDTCMPDTANNIYVWQILTLTDTCMADTANNRYMYGRYCL